MNLDPSEPETTPSETCRGQSRGNQAGVAVGADVVERAVAEAAVEAMMRGDTKLARTIVEEYRARVEAERREQLRQPVLTIDEARALRRR